MSSTAEAVSPVVHQKPVEFDEVLVGCQFARPSVNASARGGVSRVLVLDPLGKAIGTGKTLEQACWLAAQSRRTAMKSPEDYHPGLAGCNFGINQVNGEQVRTVTSRDGLRVLGTATGKEAAADQAWLTLLRDMPTYEISRAEFARLCLVLTVEIVHAKKAGQPNTLRIDPSCSSGIGDLRHAIAVECRLNRIDVNHQVAWKNERLASIQALDLEEGGLGYVPMDGRQHLILRTIQSQSKEDCITEMYETLCAQEFAEQQESQPSRERQVG